MGRRAAAVAATAAARRCLGTATAAAAARRCLCTAAAAAAARRCLGTAPAAAAAAAAAALPDPIAAALVGPPALLALTHTPAAGRGLALRAGLAGPAPAGSTLLAALPLAAAPAPEHGGAVCHGCLRSLPRGGSEARPRPGSTAWCSPACEAGAAAAGWWEVEAGAGGFPELRAVCASSASSSSDGRAARFPTLVARLASATLAAAVAGRPAPPSRVAADFLVAPRLEGGWPPAWGESYAAWAAGAARWVARRTGRGEAASGALVRAAVPLASWAADTGRVHLNAFRVEPPPAAAAGPVATLSSLGLAAAAAAAVSGGGAAGSALYGLPSLANHSCTPSAAPAWGGGGGGGARNGDPHPPTRLRLVALRDLDPGEAVTLSYIDDELPVRVRRGQLREGYGFECGCGRCLEEAGEG